jgi:serine O-acetyltransferase
MRRSRLAPVQKAIRWYLRVAYACDLWPQTAIGEGTRFPHNGLALVIHPEVVIGKNCTLCQCVTIGGRGGPAVPRIGDGVFVGAGALGLGAVDVGDNATIAAGAVVLHSVPARTTVAGNPARPVKQTRPFEVQEY